ncbi:hypothetical protein IWX50DRAFT_647278 [Phyllosticta citricarpa]
MSIRASRRPQPASQPASHLLPLYRLRCAVETRLSLNYHRLHSRLSLRCRCPVHIDQVSPAPQPVSTVAVSTITFALWSLTSANAPWQPRSLAKRSNGPSSDLGEKKNRPTMNPSARYLGIAEAFAIIVAPATLKQIRHHSIRRLPSKVVRLSIY